MLGAPHGEVLLSRGTIPDAHIFMWVTVENTNSEIQEVKAGIRAGNALIITNGMAQSAQEIMVL